MPKNRISRAKDGRWHYAAKDCAGYVRQLASKKGELKSQFVRRCDQLDLLCADPNIGSEMTYAELYERWKEDYQKVHCSQGDLDACTYVYNEILKPAIGHLRLSAITRSMVYNIISDASQAGRRKSVLSKIRSTISRPYNWAINALMMPIQNPVNGLRVKYRAVTDSANSRERVISGDDVQTFFTACAGSKYDCYFHVLYLTGLRPSEGAGLRVEDIRPDCLQIRRAVTRYGLGELKNVSSRRDIPLTPELRYWINLQLSKLPDRSGWLFPATGGVASFNAINCRAKALAKKAGVQLSLYDFRHTFATKMSAVLPLKTLQYLMGHSDIQTTMKYYVEVTEDAMKTAASEMQKIFSAQSDTKSDTKAQ